MEKKQKGVEGMNDHDLLIRLATLMDVIYKGHTNHLEHHRRRDIAMLSVTLGSIATSIIAIGCAVLAFIK